MGVAVITFVDASGDTIVVRPEAIVGVCLKKAGPCQVMLVGSVFLVVDRNTAVRIIDEARNT